MASKKNEESISKSKNRLKAKVNSIKKVLNLSFRFYG